MPQYKRPPITEAVVEFRLGELIPMSTVEKVRDRLAEFYPLPPLQIMSADIELRENNPHVVREGLAGFRLTALDGAGLTTVTPSQIVTSRTPPYEGWEAFIAAAQRNWEIWKRVVGWKKIVRIGVRYVNRLDIPNPPGNPINIEDYLTFHLTGPSMDLPPLQSFAINESRPLGKDDCMLILNSASVPSPLVNTASFLIDIDISRTSDLPQNDQDLWALIDRIRPHKNAVFESCITQRTRELFDK